MPNAYHSSHHTPHIMTDPAGQASEDMEVLSGRTTSYEEATAEKGAAADTTIDLTGKHRKKVCVCVNLSTPRPLSRSRTHGTEVLCGWVGEMVRVCVCCECMSWLRRLRQRGWVVGRTPTDLRVRDVCTPKTRKIGVVCHARVRAPSRIGRACGSQLLPCLSPNAFIEIACDVRSLVWHGDVGVHAHVHARARHVGGWDCGCVRGCSLCS
jgi:hypothetical protein